MKLIPIKPMIKKLLALILIIIFSLTTIVIIVFFFLLSPIPDYFQVTEEFERVLDIEQLELKKITNKKLLSYRYREPVLAPKNASNHCYVNFFKLDKSYFSFIEKLTKVDVNQSYHKMLELKSSSHSKSHQFEKSCIEKTPKYDNLGFVAPFFRYFGHKALSKVDRNNFNELLVHGSIKHIDLAHTFSPLNNDTETYIKYFNEDDRFVIVINHKTKIAKVIYSSWQCNSAWFCN